MWINQLPTMTGMLRIKTVRHGRIASVMSVAVMIAMAACHGILDVSDPTLIQDQDIANAAGAKSRRGDVIVAFDQTMTTIVFDVGLITDELGFDAPSEDPQDSNLPLDQRNSEVYEFAVGAQQDVHLGALDRIVSKSSIALPMIQAYADTSVRRDYLAQVFALRGYAIVQMAEDICPGFPINDVSATNIPIFSGPYTTDSALAYGITQLDSAIALAHDSAQVLNFARVAKGRALLDRGQYAEAAAALVGVPATFTYTTNATVSNLAINFCLDCWAFSNRLPVGERDGRTGLPFVSAHDPRVSTTATSYTRYADPGDTLYIQSKYPNSTTPVIVASGVEARLMRAEVLLHNNDATWIDTLNTLRSTVGLTALTAPSTDTAKVNILYSERAFWLYLTGRRLGDLRRLIHNYGRGAETVFPTGAYPLGGAYGNATAIPFVLANQAAYNAKITHGCTVR